jgi:DNA-binding transcriptional MerR regulator
MIMDDQDIQKLYHSIGEVSEKLDLEPHVLRYWESEFDVLHPRKNRAGRRVYTSDDIAIARRIQKLLKDEKYTIAGAKQVFARERRGEVSDQQLRAELKDMRSMLVQLLDRL